MDIYNKEMEKNLIEMVKQKEQSDRRLLHTEQLIAVICIISLFALCAIASFANIEDWLRMSLIVVGIAPVIIFTPFMIKIEQTAGYYACAKCGYKYIPAYKSVLFSAHIGTTRKMKCPKCDQRSWQKKVMNKD